MTFPIVYSDHVESDIDSTLNYIVNRLCNIKAARDLLDDIKRCEFESFVSLTMVL